MNIVELKSVSVLYDSLAALNNVDLEVKEGEWLAVMGPSGSGKTTMMNIVGCLDRATSGTTIFDGEDISKASLKTLTAIRREKIGLIFQQFHLVPYLNALQNVMLAQYYHSMADEREAKKALERVGLGDRGKHLPKELSGGERQRVCIARALINYPKLILADEPTGNLDEENEKIVMDIFANLNAEGSAIIVVTHDKTVAKRAERAVWLKHGRIANRAERRQDERKDRDEHFSSLDIE
ncbi:MAG: ABC transporter ATP-binding protein [Helicobacteraceae bacterium]|jgi:putative ABC transport system ATP-binding protein|nr:ABC transporter ATP-binding protein [Helicobacteraceae bacterium]